MRIILLMIALSISNLVFAQRSETEMQKRLLEIGQTEEQANSDRKARVEAYAKEKGVAIWQYKEDRTIMLYDVNENGHPVFIATLNEGAAVTTGASFIADKEQFGIGLTGEGVKIAVWDGGLIRSSHVELTGSVSQQDSPSGLSDHANHVTGTILAKGLNKAARGMAPRATSVIYDFNNDLSEISAAASSDDSGIILSNHSYGTITGWDRGQWYGDASISENEDWRFGFYNSAAASLDAVSHNSPYYLIAFAAGNDRGDSGSGPQPADGPYDIIPYNGNAKNILTVGAVLKIPGGYKNPSDVVMSNFSSWGPTDDGRIKPDLVGAGVNLFSVYSGSDDAYASISGTSMATPNVVGTLALVQELNKKLYGTYLKSSALKGLAIHTAYEAGLNDGPDYQHGWGLMNAVGASELIVAKNGSDRIIENYVLNTGESFSLPLNPSEGSEVKVTICWTDLPGTPTTAQLDPQDLMLVNDLDLRVTGTDESYMPYILDPARPAFSATTGDNFRDNVEKIEFTATGQAYELTVNHKGNLQGGQQEFSLIVSYESEGPDVFYWIGGTDGDWSNTANWSKNTGGVASDNLPGKNDKVVFDNNSFEALDGSSNISESVQFNLNQDIEIASLLAVSEQIDFNLNGHDLTIYGSLSASFGEVNFSGDGNIILKEGNTVNNSINAKENTFENVNLIVDYEDESILSMSGEVNFRKLHVRNGAVSLSKAETTFDSLILDNESRIIISDSEISFASYLALGQSADLTSSNSELYFEDGVRLDANGKLISSEITLRSGTLSVASDVVFDQLTLNAGSIMNIDEGITVSIMDQFLPKGVEVAPVTITSGGTATLSYEKNELLCFNYLNVDGVNVSGDGAFNVGVNGNINNATGWQSLPCEEVVFSNFEFSSVCEGGVEQFVSKSNGVDLSYKWYADDVLISEEESPYLEFSDANEQFIRLEVTNGDGISDSYSIEVRPSANTIAENEIFLSGTQLVSRMPGETYQWFKDGVALEGETDRTYTLPGGEGSFFVVTGDNSCTRKSSEFFFRVTSADEDLFETEYTVFPNPASNVVNIAVESAYSGAVEIRMTELSGREIYLKSFEKNGFQLSETINTAGLSDGLYIITISQCETKQSKMVAVRQ
ncbi:MAG: S8 family serine peptidase [Cyclobacteriaceae bacterium]